LTQKGRVTYVPPSVFDELRNIMDEEQLSKRSQAFNKMVNFSQVGREATKIKRAFLGGK
jgi:hypothetical protein